MEGAANEAEKVIEQEDAKGHERNHDEGGHKWVGGGHPGEPNGEDIFSQTQGPITDWLGNGVDRGASAGLGAVRRERHSASEESGGPTQLGGGGASRGVRKNGCGGRPDEGVNGIPNGIDVRDFVREELGEIENSGEDEDRRVGKAVKGRRKMNDTETLEQAQRGDSRVQIQTGGEPGAESQAERGQGIHWIYDTKRRPRRRTVTSDERSGKFHLTNGNGPEML